MSLSCSRKANVAEATANQICTAECSVQQAMLVSHDCVVVDLKQRSIIIAEVNAHHDNVDCCKMVCSKRVCVCNNKQSH